MNTQALLNESIAHFLTVFPTRNPPRNLRQYISEILRASYTEEVVEIFLDARYDNLRDFLIIEFNERDSKGISIRYSFADDDGNVIRGIGDLAESDLITFQDGLNELSSSEFEAFSAQILRWASCTRVWKTQETHDEGLDAFGYSPYLQINGEWIGRPEVVFLAQAKHYSDCKVGSRDIREFVGSTRLAMHRVYSKVDNRYIDLDIKPFSPVALIFITTQEVPRTVKHMARSSGLVVLTSDDLCRLFFAHITLTSSQLSSAAIAEMIRKLCADIETAK